MSFRPPFYLHSGEQFGFEVFGEETEKIAVSESGFLDNYAGISTAGLREVLVEDDDGNLVVKIQPRKRDKSITYVIKSNDNISQISHKFGLEPRTVYWANDLTVKSTLQVGQKLQIPPTDGIFYKVRSGDTLSEIAKSHGIEISKILAYNQIKNATIKPDESIFLPDAKKIYIAKKKPTYSGGKSSSSSGKIESIGFRLRRPTKGILTQGFKRGHYALDIANKLNTPIYAAASGTVIKSSSGWNYGYGNYIVIDHGNGVETLYGHNNVRKVAVGDQVKTGQLISLMGNSGRVWGVTGIHLHLEVRIRGRKVNPNNYF